MKNITFVLFILILGCNIDHSEMDSSSSSEVSVLEKKEIEKIVENSTKTRGSSFDIKYYDNILEELWSAYLEKEDTLNQVLERFNTILSVSKKEEEKLQDYQEANDSYYNLSILATEKISDSLERKSLVDQLENSQAFFEESMIPIEAINGSINTIHSQILDEITRLKIEKTLLLIEQYQKQNKIAPEKIEKIQKDLNAILEELKQN